MYSLLHTVYYTVLIIVYIIAHVKYQQKETRIKFSIIITLNI